jgi:predicted ABC-type sugar transport system permease subunit
MKMPCGFGQMSWARPCTRFLLLSAIEPATARLQPCCAGAQRFAAGNSVHQQRFKEIGMRKILLSVLAATTLLSTGLLASRAAATTRTETATAVAASHPLVRVASIVCGGAGCNVVQTKPLKHRKLQWLGHG